MVSFYARIKVALLASASMLVPIATAAADAGDGEWVELPLSVSQKSFARVMAVPEITMTTGLTAQVLVPTGTALFDPFDFHVVDDKRMWVADDGKNGAIFRGHTRR